MCAVLVPTQFQTNESKIVKGYFILLGNTCCLLVDVGQHFGDRGHVRPGWVQNESHLAQVTVATNDQTLHLDGPDFLPERVSQEPCGSTFRHYLQLVICPSCATYLLKAPGLRCSRGPLPAARHCNTLEHREGPSNKQDLCCQAWL